MPKRVLYLLLTVSRGKRYCGGCLGVRKKIKNGSLDELRTPDAGRSRSLSVRCRMVGSTIGHKLTWPVKLPTAGLILHLHHRIDRALLQLLPGEQRKTVVYLLHLPVSLCVDSPPGIGVASCNGRPQFALLVTSTTR